MDFNATVDLIIKDLNEAREIIDDLKNYPGVPALQVELAKSKCKSAAEVIALLKNLKDRDAVEKRDPITPEPVKKEASVKRMPESHKPEEVEVKAEVRQPPPIDTKSRSGRTSKKTSGSAIVADTFSQLPSSLNEQLGSRRDEDDVSDLMKTKPITNLSEAIGVNDKFLFIREIFNGNPESYEQGNFKPGQMQQVLLMPGQ